MRNHPSLALFLSFVLVVSSQKSSANTPSIEEVILSYPIRRIVMEDAYLPGALSFLRLKATESLRQTKGDKKGELVMIFELSFDPDGNRAQSKLNETINYRADRVSLEEAMRNCLEQVGLDYKFVSENRIAIIDKK